MMGAETPMRRRPNVLVIMTDQHRYDLMGCAGDRTVPTPNIDRLAERGVRFTDAYCASPICVASRMSMLTGLASHTTGVVKNDDRLDWRCRTIAHHFAEHGYLTGLIGKMHFNDSHAHGFGYYTSINDWLMYLGPKQQLYADEIASHPLSPVFADTVFDTGAGFPDLEDVWKGPSPWVGKVRRSEFNDMASLLPEEDHLDAFLARQSVQFMERHRESPFLLIASLMKPHTPLFAPAEWAAKYPIDEMVLPEVGDISSYPHHLRGQIEAMQRSPQRMQRAHRAGYLANLAYVDVCIGRIVDWLERSGLLEDTIVVYTSDHGEMHGSHGLYQKFCLFEPAVRVPLIICDPREDSPGRRSDALIEQVGLYPTLSELAGLPTPTSTALVDWPAAPTRIEGVSFAAQVRGEDGGPDAAFSEFNVTAPIRESMIRTRRWKYVHNHGSTHELYDLEQDPGETVNRISDTARSAVVAELRARLLAWHDPATERGQALRAARA
jgi:choline-sulfatase